jgi:hypothetical protein
LNSSDNESSSEQPANDTPAQQQEKVWQEQAQQTRCHYENPQMAPNGCLMGCGKLVCDGPVRFLDISMGQGSAVATWVPPLSAALGQTYIVELSYDGNTWRNLPLEQPWATFARFQVDEGKPFQLRVTASGYPSAVKKFDFAAASKSSQANEESANTTASSQINNEEIESNTTINSQATDEGLEADASTGASTSSNSQATNAQSTTASTNAQFESADENTTTTPQTANAQFVSVDDTSPRATNVQLGRESAAASTTTTSRVTSAQSESANTTTTTSQATESAEFQEIESVEAENNSTTP